MSSEADDLTTLDIEKDAPISPLVDMNLIYRSILPQDKDRIQELHEQFFPVRYSPQFYQDMVEGKGIFGGNLYSVIVENGKKEVVGFVLAQMLAYPSQCDDHDLFSSNDSVQEVFYILTIGSLPEYRKQGIASKLIHMCIEYAQGFPSCGAVSFSRSSSRCFLSFPLICDSRFLLLAGLPSCH
jgi:ribosomal protein S18 acetylase RimI-like enzyme